MNKTSPRAESAGHDQNVELGTGLERVVREHPHAASRGDRAAALSHKKHLEGRRLVETLLFIEPGHREHLKRTTEIEDLYVLEDHNANALPLHSLRSSIYTRAARSQIGDGRLIPVQCVLSVRHRGPVFRRHAFQGGEVALARLLSPVAMRLPLAAHSRPAAR
jgi:hypothetical protein